MMFMPFRLLVYLALLGTISVFGQQNLSVDGIKIGMTLADVKTIHPDAAIETAPNKYGNCADNIDFGYEIRKNNTLLAFVNLNSDEKISTMIVTAPKFKFSGVSTSSKVGSVLKLYPNAKLTNDSLDDWEYIYLQNPNITLGFETDESNRVGLYDDERFVRLNRKNAKVDFIEIQ